ncbi:MAG: hypothetical protein JXN59_02460 [Anaerolineae bacterium]|nr:hypothetical protein [Anaerolineae bacterium]
MNHVQRPEVGDRVEIGKMAFEIVEVQEIMPPRGDFQFLHATVKPIEKRKFRT